MNILIIEDEETAGLRLTKMLQEIDRSIRIIAILESIESSLSYLKSSPQPDLIFADIHLADGPSFEIFKNFKIQCPIIFTTAYDQYALQAFKFNGIDYLLKPIKKQELEESLKKFRLLKSGEPRPLVDFKDLLETIKGKTNFQKRIVIRFGQTIRTLEISDIAYFYTEEKVTFACTLDGKRWPLDFTLDELEEIINPSEFFRINRQFIIYIKAIDSMQSYSKSRIKVLLKPHSDIETIVSTERSAEFKEWLLGK